MFSKKKETFGGMSTTNDSKNFTQKLSYFNYTVKIIERRENENKKIHSIKCHKV